METFKMTKPTSQTFRRRNEILAFQKATSLCQRAWIFEETKNNEWKVVDSENKPIAFFATRHGKGASREVLAPYIRKILQAIKDDQNDENNDKQL
jgi:hypothetical protein